MSRLIKKPIAITSGATLVQSGDVLTIKGPKGEIEDHRSRMALRLRTKERISGSARPRRYETPRIQGTVWALVKNAIEGVTVGFTKVLELEGVGYRVVLEGKELVLFLDMRCRSAYRSRTRLRFRGEEHH